MIILLSYKFIKEVNGVKLARNLVLVAVVASVLTTAPMSSFAAENTNVETVTVGHQKVTYETKQLGDTRTIVIDEEGRKSVISYNEKTRELRVNGQVTQVPIEVQSFANSLVANPEAVCSCDRLPGYTLSLISKSSTAGDKMSLAVTAAMLSAVLKVPYNAIFAALSAWSGLQDTYYYTAYYYTKTENGVFYSYNVTYLYADSARTQEIGRFVSAISSSDESGD